MPWYKRLTTPGRLLCLVAGAAGPADVVADDEEEFFGDFSCAATERLDDDEDDTDDDEPMTEARVPVIAFVIRLERLVLVVFDFVLPEAVAVVVVAVAAVVFSLDVAKVRRDNAE